MDTGAPWSALPDAALLATAYLGARPIVDALERDADIVITGRVADASLFLAACVHEPVFAFACLGVCLEERDCVLVHGAIADDFEHHVGRIEGGDRRGSAAGEKP